MIVGIGTRRTVRWRSLDRRSVERTTMFLYKGFWHLIGTIKVDFDGVPSAVKYEIVCRESWTTNLAIVKIRGVRSDRLSLGVRDDGRWNVNRVERPDLEGCIDIDLEVTPSTNTLPIRRLNLGIGESREVRAAWVRFPSLTVEPLRQRYTRIGETRYRFDSVDSGFSADIDVDDAGLVVHYPGGWTRSESLYSA